MASASSKEIVKGFSTMADTLYRAASSITRRCSLVLVYTSTAWGCVFAIIVLICE